jgi:hypothetical protein
MSAPNILDPELDRWLLPHCYRISSSSIKNDLRSTVVARLWGTSSHQCLEDYSAYFQHFAITCEAWRSSPVAIQTYRDLLDLVQHLRTHPNDARASPIILNFFPPPPLANMSASDLRMPLTIEQMHTPLARRHTSCSKDSVLNAISIAVCLWLMLSSGGPASTSFPGRSTLIWNDDESLNDLIEKALPKTDPKESLRWPQSLNLHNLERVAGFEIVWTDHLADHLYLNEDLRTINVYHHACVLESQKSAEQP